MIIFTKLMEHYDEEYLKSKLEKAHFVNMKGDKKYVSLDTITKNINISEINYGLEDFIEDYPQYKKHKEIKTIFNIQKSGESIGNLSEQNKCMSLSNHIKEGFDYNSKDYKGKEGVLKYLDIEVNLEEFEVRILKRCVDLRGRKEDLESFKNKYNIRYSLLCGEEKNSWHLPFDGMLSDWIRNNN